jgi:hypothetical protein
METKQTAEEILNYCFMYLVDNNPKKLSKFKKDSLYKEMIKEIEFLIDTD